jgi:hypothetical protein
MGYKQIHTLKQIMANSQPAIISILGANQQMALKFHGIWGEMELFIKLRSIFVTYRWDF